jgi:hypothetical protein
MGAQLPEEMHGVSLKRENQMSADALWTPETLDLLVALIS